jgi:uncharacterized protein YecE (DUF72 family)
MTSRIWSSWQGGCAYAARAREVWCIFDNTALFAATPNALSLLARLV